MSDGQKLKDASGQVQEGISKVSEGAKTLSDGQTKFYKEGVKKLDDGVNKDLKNVIDRFKLRRRKTFRRQFYTAFRRYEGSVKFIYETEPIEISDKE